ncbi:efflux RND transporter periplasmic adaptor subunit [Luteolibacter luteus]|uniref:Efflux RND transporter periplasmic adaptor subunit n=1 Tax=Luteolibacter luteus TaxID=2728835 RepID=A0A858RHA0_9BACT|nr:efflux RND transporter periplasmic adaptor subunit [Luteolibacter luteus]QJE95924.1 efflux RND transporter periplasmic adaptor subunit [Luteolibacter luteus]
MTSRTILISLLTAPALLAQEPLAVRTVAPSPATQARVYDLPGRTEPVEQARIFSRATGTVKERPVDIGDRVKAGDPLAVIDIPEIERELESAKASVDQAVARANIARSTANRSAGLAEAKAVSKEESEQREASAAELEAAVRVAKAEVSRLEELQKFGIVRAPFDGTVSGRRIDVGDFVRGDSSTTAEWAFQMMRINQLRFAVGATPDVALRLTPETEAAVRFTELPGRSFPAKVSRSSKSFDTATGTMRVELLLDNADFTLPAGLTGTVGFKLMPAPGTYLLPNNTLVLREGKSTVALVEDGKVKFIDVLPGRNLGPQMEVTSAELKAESQVIVSPNAMLRAGDPVNASPLVVAGK